MHRWTVSVEDAKRLLSSTDFAYLAVWFQDDLAKSLADLPQPPEMGMAEDDEYKLSMLDHALAEAGRRRTR